MFVRSIRADIFVGRSSYRDMPYEIFLDLGPIDIYRFENRATLRNTRPFCINKLKYLLQTNNKKLKTNLNHLKHLFPIVIQLAS